MQVVLRRVIRGCAVWTSHNDGVLDAILPLVYRDVTAVMTTQAPAGNDYIHHDHHDCINPQMSVESFCAVNFVHITS